jgi:hypothetical protein
MPVSVLTFDTFQQRAEGDGEKLKWKEEVQSPREKLKLGKQKAETGGGSAGLAAGRDTVRAEVQKAES